MADEEEELARAKQHSTVGQAIRVGKQYVPLAKFFAILNTYILVNQDEREACFIDSFLPTLSQNHEPPTVDDDRCRQHFREGYFGNCYRVS